MFENPSLMTRIIVGKTIGLIFGLIGFFILPLMVPDVGLMFRLAILCWYTTVGAMIGVFGVFSYHPMLHLPMPWWFRSTWIGGWMNFVLVLFIHDELAPMMKAVLGENTAFSSPFWLVLEGVIIGLIIGYFSTRFGGEGKDTVGY